LSNGTKEIRLILNELHPAQEAALQSFRRFNVVACGRRWGKTVLGSDWLIDPALDGFPVAWFSPTYKMLGEVWREVKGLLAPVTQAVSVQDHRLELLTGGVVDMWSLDSFDSVRGRKYKRVALDEAAMVPNLEEAWNAAIRPTLTDYQGDAGFFSTPKGMNFFRQAFSHGQDDLFPEWYSCQQPTVANPYISPDEVEAARLSLPERVFQQEYLAMFLEDAGGVFRGVREVIDAGRKENEEPKVGERYGLGVDIARVQDFTVLSVLDSKKRQVYHERFNQISWERQLAAIERVSLKYNKARVLMDSTGVGDPIYEALRKKGLSVEGYGFTNASKEALIDALALSIENKSIALMDLPTQTNELQAYQYELTAARNVRMNAPEGMHDDCVIALALSNWLMGKSPVTLRIRQFK
jgi:hypothetical protein